MAVGRTSGEGLCTAPEGPRPPGLPYRAAKLSVSRLAEGYSMSFAAVQKHVAVLERAGLVSKQRRGREQLVTTDLDAVRRARRALDEYEAIWRGRVDRMAHLLDEETGTT
ncbi:ArsR/SmtB family transcription factor [Nonomuraea sp. NPDC050536]|uniref:ArsR/SmtB family transcription factor n=1 Tax=Nonomuraea sp. NPDC050536 TaxID=3364366 RepID=UPI0037CC4A30